MSESFADQTTSIESAGKDQVTTSRLAIASLVLGVLSLTLVVPDWFAWHNPGDHFLGAN